MTYFSDVPASSPVKSASSWEADNSLMLPVLTFLLVAAGVISLFLLLETRERENIQLAIEEESTETAALIQSSTEQKIFALQRMAARWNVRGGTPKEEWEPDALNYLERLADLKTVQWIDGTYHIRWITPESGNESLIGLNMYGQAKQPFKISPSSVVKDLPSVTGLLDLLPDYKGFMVYVPLRYKDKSQGFIAGAFSIKETMQTSHDDDHINNFLITLKDIQGGSYTLGNPESVAADIKPKLKQIKIFDQTWTLEMTPQTEFIDAQRTLLPQIFLISGLLRHSLDCR